MAEAEIAQGFERSCDLDRIDAVQAACVLNYIIHISYVYIYMCTYVLNVYMYIYIYVLYTHTWACEKIRCP